MTDEEFKAYVDNRIAKMLEYYDSRAVTNQRRYHVCWVYVLIVSVAITPILAIDFIKREWIWGKIIAAVLSPTVAVVSGIAAHFKYHDHWLSYRAAWDALNSELALHDAEAGPYGNSKDRNALFAERAESIIRGEGQHWYALHQKDEPIKSSSRH